MRRTDWLERLWAVLEGDAARREFAYGGCVRLACECLEAIAGTDHRERCELLIAAASEEGGIALEALEREATELLGEPVPIGLAHRGDIVLLDLHELPTGGPTLGVCVGEKIACAGGVGVVYLRRERGLKAWRVA